jgi:hypothetical protein
MSKVKKALNVAMERAKDGTLSDIINRWLDYMDAGLPFTEAVQAELADLAVMHYSKPLGAALRRHGFNVEDGEVIDGQVLTRCINEKAGLNIQSLTADGVKSALDEKVSGRMSDLLGVEVQTIMDVDKLKEALLAGALEAVQSGRATKLITGAIIRKIKKKKAWDEGGVATDVDRAKLLNRAYQKKYRRTHRLVWDKPGEEITENP